MLITPRKAETPPYTALAAGYDVVMAHVEYDLWAEYIHGLLERHHPGATSILELGCGTGTFALEFYQQGDGDFDYIATDGAAEMITLAQQKAKGENTPVHFAVMDFTQVVVPARVDVVLLLYDGLNYLLEADAVLHLFQEVYRALKPGGVFVFDQSTPANSINNADFFEDRGRTRGFDYVRKSIYDPDTRLHTTTFDLTAQGARFQERHIQRAYSLGEIRALIQQTNFKECAAYDDFTIDPATDDTERIHWVVQR